MTRFVTGGAGFIGANYLFYLREHYPLHYNWQFLRRFLRDF